jgi:hypothetical protein
MQERGGFIILKAIGSDLDPDLQQRQGAIFLTANTPSSNTGESDPRRSVKTHHLVMSIPMQKFNNPAMAKSVSYLLPVPVPAADLLDKGKGNGRGAIGVLKPQGCLQPSPGKSPFHVVVPVTTSVPEGGIKMLFIKRRLACF